MSDSVTAAETPEPTEELRPGPKFVIPDFYLVLFGRPGDMTCYEQTINSEDFDATLKDLMDGQYEGATNVLLCSPEGVEDISVQFARSWMARLQDAGFRMGQDTLPVFIEEWLPEVATMHWSLSPSGRRLH